MATRKESRFAGTRIYTLSAWQQAVAGGGTERGYREWVEDCVLAGERERIEAGEREMGDAK